MSVPRSQAELVIDQLGPVLGLEIGRFFSGWSLMRFGIQFGMVMDTVYAKVPPERRDAWRAAGCRPFSYARKDGRTITVEAYWALPDAALDNPTLLGELLLDGAVPTII